MTVTNARIENTFLGIQDHGILTAWLTLDDPEGQGSNSFGCYSFDHSDGRRVIGHAFAAVFIRKVLGVVAVDQWEKVRGAFIRVERDEEGRITRIGHIVQNIWFDPKAAIAESQGAAA